MRFLRVCLVISALGFLLMSPEQIAGDSSNWGTADDSNYLAHATALVYGQFPDYSREYAPYGPSNHSIGPSLLALPFVFVFSLVDRAFDSPIVQKRTLELIPTSWTGYGFMLATEVYFLLGIALLLLVCQDLFPSAPAELVVVLSVAASGLPFYAFRRPIFTPVYEFFLISAGLFLLTSALKRRAFTLRPVLFRALSFAVAAMLFLVRYNDIVFSAMLLLVLETAAAPDRSGAPRFWPISKPLIIQWVGLALVVALAVVFVMWLRKFGKGLWNPEEVRIRLFELKSAKYYLFSVAHLLLGIDWGLIFSAPLVLLGLRGLFLMGRDRPYLLALASVLAVNFVIAVSWGAQGSSYGHRYFVTAALPLATVGLASWLENAPGTARSRRLKMIALAVFPVCMLLVFENRPEFSLEFGSTPWGIGWVNNTYALNVLKALILAPGAFCNAAFGFGGFSYFYGGWEDEGLKGYWNGTSAKLAISWLLPIAVGAAAAIIERRRSRA